MDQNPYAAPSFDESPRVADASSDVVPWFAVGTRKLWLMSIVSLGIYVLFWFERQYRFQKRARLESTRPVWRAIFSVFFAHDLFRRVEFAAAGANVETSWTSRSMGGLFVVVAIAGSVLEKVGDKLLTGTAGYVLSYISVLMAVGLAYPIARVQDTVNQLLQSSSPNFERNDRLTAWNWIVVAFGGLVLAFATLGLVLPMDEEPGGSDPTLDFSQQ